jgi:hypothetical protein
MNFFTIESNNKTLPKLAFEIGPAVSDATDDSSVSYTYLFEYENIILIVSGGSLVELIHEFKRLKNFVLVSL